MKHRVYSLDILRLSATLLVLFFHEATNFTQFSFGRLNTLVSNQAIVMILFFILSGFVLEYQYYDINFDSIAEIKTFYLSRMVAIYPAYLIVLFTQNDFGLHSIKDILLIIPVRLFLLQNAVTGMDSYFGGGGTWFISCLAFSYVLFPAFHRLIRKLEKRECVLMLCFLYGLNSIASLSVTNTSMPISEVYSSMIFRSFQFFIGMLIALYVQTSKTEVVRKRVYSGLIISIVLLVLFQWGMNRLFSIRFRQSEFFAIPLFSIMLYLTFYIPEGDVLYKMASTKVWQYLSKLSFSIYLCQGYIFILYNKNKWLITSNNLVNIVVFTGLTIVTSAIFEKIVGHISRVLKHKARNLIM